MDKDSPNKWPVPYSYDQNTYFGSDPPMPTVYLDYSGCQPRNPFVPIEFPPPSPGQVIVLPRPRPEYPSIQPEQSYDQYGLPYHRPNSGLQAGYQGYDPNLPYQLDRRYDQQNFNRRPLYNLGSGPGNSRSSVFPPGGGRNNFKQVTSTQTSAFYEPPTFGHGWKQSQPERDFLLMPYGDGPYNPSDNAIITPDQARYAVQTLRGPEQPNVQSLQPGSTNFPAFKKDKVKTMVGIRGRKVKAPKPKPASKKPQLNQNDSQPQDVGHQNVVTKEVAINKQVPTRQSTRKAANLANMRLLVKTSKIPKIQSELVEEEHIESMEEDEVVVVADLVPAPADKPEKKKRKAPKTSRNPKRRKSSQGKSSQKQKGRKSSTKSTKGDGPLGSDMEQEREEEQLINDPQTPPTSVVTTVSQACGSGQNAFAAVEDSSKETHELKHPEPAGSSASKKSLEMQERSRRQTSLGTQPYIKLTRLESIESNVTQPCSWNSGSEMDTSSAQSSPAKSMNFFEVTVDNIDENIGVREKQNEDETNETVTIYASQSSSEDNAAIPDLMNFDDLFRSSEECERCATPCVDWSEMSNDYDFQGGFFLERDENVSVVETIVTPSSEDAATVKKRCTEENIQSIKAVEKAKQRFGHPDMPLL